MTSSKPVEAVVSDTLRDVLIQGKCGRGQLQGLVANALTERGYVVDTEDEQCFLRTGMPVWRSKDTGLVEPTAARRKIDVVVYSGSHPIALVETESDLNDLKRNGVTRRNGHYDVASISRGKSGRHFDSYKSLERMAAAAFYAAVLTHIGQYPTSVAGVEALESLASDSPEDNNPLGLELILVSGFCRPYDKSILLPRLQSLGASLICVSGSVA